MALDESAVADSVFFLVRSAIQTMAPSLIGHLGGSAGDSSIRAGCCATGLCWSACSYRVRLPGPA